MLYLCQEENKSLGTLVSPSTLRGLPGCDREFRAMRLPFKLGKHNSRLSRLLFSILDLYLLF